MNGPLIRFVIKNNDYIYPLYFTMQSKDFMMNIGCYCLTDKNYSFGKNELTKVKLEQNNNNFDAMYNRILSPLEKVGLRIERGQYTGELYYVRLPRIIRSSKWSDRTETSEIGYKKISETIIYTKLDSLIFASDSEIQNVFSKILAQLNRTSKWIDKGEKEQMEQFSRSLYIQSQREFINYK